MFVDEMRAAIEAAPRVRLAELSAALWKAFGAGAIGEAEAQQLAELIEARKVVPAAAPPTPRRVGSRPRSGASMERRRRWVSSGWMPPQLATRFTMAEAAALAVVAAEVARTGRCELPLEGIAGRAGVSRSTVKSALRQARVLALLSVEHRPDRPFKHLSNVVRIVSGEWQAWLSMRRSSQGVKVSPPTSTYFSSRERRDDSRPISKRRVDQDGIQHRIRRPWKSIRAEEQSNMGQRGKGRQ